MNKKEQTKKAIKESLIQAMQKSMGVVTEACKVAGVGRTTFYSYYNTDPVFQKACDECEHIALDFAESQLYKQIKDGSTTATIFYLKTKGKQRGYVERQQIDINKGQPDLSHLSSDDLIALLNE